MKDKQADSEHVTEVALKCSEDKERKMAYSRIKPPPFPQYFVSKIISTVTDVTGYDDQQTYAT